MMGIAETVQNVYDKINDVRSKKKIAEDVVLVTVTKTVDLERIEQALAAGADNIGENKVQEILDKYDQLKGKVDFHMIGHLQTNKVKYIIDKVVMIHSVDSFRLAEEIEKQAQKKNLQMDILIQINMAGEETKFGIEPQAAIELVQKISGLEHLRVKGLMTVAPYVENPEDNRAIFEKMKKLSQKIENKNIPRVEMNYLSMGMSNDYLVAIEEGANMVRVGSEIFGKRNY